jgi:RNA-directed DNA polymerase
MKSIHNIQSLSFLEKERLSKFIGNGLIHSDVFFNNYFKHELNAMVFLSIEKPVHLCRFLNTSFTDLQNNINQPYYRHFEINKKRGGIRDIYAPAPQLSKYQKCLNYYLQAYYLCIKPDEVYGFVVNPHYLGTFCNIVENARNHVGKKHILNIDLKDFFPGIRAKRVKDLFASSIFGFNDEMATALALLTTFNGKMPIGSPTSPVISNFICQQLDSELIKFSNENNVTYSRYADDLTFSSDENISHELVESLIKLIEKNDFQINNQKLRLVASNRKQTVTGITVNEKVNVDRKLLKKTRAMLHDLTENGVIKATKKHFNITGNLDERIKNRFVNRLEGYINFIGQVRGKTDVNYLNLKSKFDGLYKTR